MNALQFKFSIPRYLIGMTLGKLYPPLLWSGLSCLTPCTLPKPVLPGNKWALIRTRLGGICGSDLSAIYLHLSPYYLPLTSFPYTLGHENMGVVEETGSKLVGFQPGDRVVVTPGLPCEARGFNTLCRYCEQGETNLCERMTEGDLAAGLLIGACRDTGGSWGTYFLAHQSQLHHVPVEVSDEDALMAEPFAVGLHAVLLDFPRNEETVLIIGGGTIGLCTLAALRALGSQARIVVLARHSFQAEKALEMGADLAVHAGRKSDYYEQIAHLTGAKVSPTLFNKKVVTGGVDLTLECVGTHTSLDDALRLTRNAGRVTLLSVPGEVHGVDLTPAMNKELSIKATYAYHNAEPYQGKPWNAFDLALKLMTEKPLHLGQLITHKFPLHEYGRAFNLLRRRAGNQIIKAAFEFK